MSKVNLICLQRVDFTNDQGQRVIGMNAWYLDPPSTSGDLIGTRPQKIWLSQDFLARNDVSRLGDYEYESTPRGRLVSLKKL